MSEQQVTIDEIVKALEYLYAKRDLIERIRQHGVAPPDGYVLVPIDTLEQWGEPVAWMQIDINDKPTNLFFNSVPEDDYHTYRPLYTAPPSIDALIAQAIKDYIAKVTVIKSVNLRTQAQPYLDELIAEIDEWGYRVGGKPDIKEIVDKWRTK